MVIALLAKVAVINRRQNMTFDEIMLTRRSIRAYLDKPVERAKLDKILRAGAYAPSALNNQARQFIAITDPKILKKLNRAVEKMVDEQTRARIKGRSESGEFNFFYNAPVLILVTCSVMEKFPAEDCACALENMFLTAHSEGLGSCWINQLSSLSLVEPFNSFLRSIGMKDAYKVYGCCALGYPAVEGKLSKPKLNDIIVL